MSQQNQPTDPRRPIITHRMRRFLTMLGAVGTTVLTGFIAADGIKSGKILEGVGSVGMLALTGILAGIARRQDPPSSALLAPRTVEDVEKHLAEIEEQNRRLRLSCREFTSAAREQKTRIDELAISAEILKAGLASDNATDAASSILEPLMNYLEAEGAALWVMSEAGDTMHLQSRIGLVAAVLDEQVIRITPEMRPSEIRRQCEQQLADASPLPPELPSERPVEKDGILDPRVEIRPATMALALREEGLNGSSGSVAAVVGLCAARAGRFSPSAPEKLNALSVMLAGAVAGLEQRRRLSRRVREISVLHEMSALVQSTTTMMDLYDAVLDMVGKLIPYENCTVFVLEPDHKKLAQRATRGRAVNLMDHIPFEHGSGISGWVAERKKQLIINDLSREQGLLNVELIPPSVRSFISVPMIVQENLIGVLNVSHSRPRAFTQDDVRILSILAGQAAVTIERTEVLRSLEQMAITDGLTHLINRRHFETRLLEEIKRADRYSVPMSLCMMDLDNFKLINDRYGHSVGDIVLSETAGIIRGIVRDTEIVARYGGEEFVMILPQTLPHDALIAAERIRSTVQSHLFRSDSGAAIPVTISIGLAGYPEHASTRDELVQRADAALYMAKEQGRNRVALYTV